MLKLILIKILYLAISALFICMALFIYLGFSLTNYYDSATVYPYIYLALFGLSLVVAGYFFIAFLKIKLDKSEPQKLNF